MSIVSYYEEFIEQSLETGSMIQNVRANPTTTTQPSTTMTPKYINPTYVLHHGDNPSQQLVPIKMNGNNYHTWVI